MFSQHKFESDIYKTLEYGDETYLASMSGKSVGYYSQMLNPDDPRESTLFRSARDLYHLILKDPVKGCETLQKFVSFVKTAVPSNVKFCVEVTRRKALKERMESDLAEMGDAPMEDRIHELEEAIVAAQEYLAALRAQGEPAIRKEMREKVNGRSAAP